MDAVILCGGKGTRLKSVVSDRPKPMAELNGKPFLQGLIEYAAGFGVRRFILCAGYMADVIEKHFSAAPPGLEVVVSRETEPLDTAGAVKNAAALIHTPQFLVMNGDSLCRIDLRALMDFHFSRGGRVSVAVARVADTGSFGSVTRDAGGRILSFREKAAAGAGWNSLDTHLVTNGHTYPATGDTRWAGPYAITLPVDPWGRPYVINAANFTSLTTPPTPIWVLSAGPNGVINTSIATTAAATVTGGDDIGFRVR